MKETMSIEAMPTTQQSWLNFELWQNNIEGTKSKSKQTAMLGTIFNVGH